MSTSEQFIAGLRDLADYLEANPDVCGEWLEYASGVGINLFEHTPEAYATKVRDLIAGAALGTITKTGNDNFMSVVRSFGPHSVEVNISRTLACEKVQVGTRVVEKPDPEKLAEVPAITVEEPVYEWRCEPVLAKSLDEVPA